MAEWVTRYGGTLRNERLLTKEEINERYPIDDNSYRAKLTREAVEKGYDILYGEHPRISLYDFFGLHNWRLDVLETAADLYGTSPDNIEIGGYTDMSLPNVIYAAVKKRSTRR